MRDGDTLELADGLVVHLAGLEAPRSDKLRTAEARATLERLMAHREVQLAYGGAKRAQDAAVEHMFAKTEGGRWVWMQCDATVSGTSPPFADAYNFAKRIKALHGLTPFEHVCAVWTKDRDRFKVDPTHLTVGLST